MRMSNNIIIIVMIACIVAGCGGGATVELAGDCGEGSCGGMRLTVHGAKSFNTTIDHGRIRTYRVTVSGPGIEEKLIGEFPGDASEGVIGGVPAGDDRLIEVTAINDNEVAIRAGEAENVAIAGGSTSDVEVTLESVPIFINLSSDAVVENTRLIFRVFAEPPGPVAIEDVTADMTAALVDAATSLPEVALDVTTGLGRLAPTMILPGLHSFVVRNTVTGRSSAVSVRLLDGTKRRGAPFFAASDTGASPDYPLRRAGDALSGSVVEGYRPMSTMYELIMAE